MNIFNFIVQYFANLSGIEILAQVFGLLSVICGVIMPQFGKKLHMLIVCFFANLFAMLNVLILDGMGSAIYLFLVVYVQIAVSIYHNQSGKPVKTIESVIFGALFIICGSFGLVNRYIAVQAFNWEVILQIFPIVGAFFAMLLVFNPSEQKTRIYQICNSSFWAVYYGCIGSSTFIGQILTIISCIVGLFRGRKK